MNEKRFQRMILVAGGAGYVGVPLCMALLRDNQVIALDRCFFGKTHLNNLLKDPGFSLWESDTRAVKARDMNGVDCIVDLAGISNDASAELDEYLTWDINVGGGLNLAHAAMAAGVQRYIYASSASVYGFSAQTGLVEKSPCQPKTCYAVSKLAVESALMKLSCPRFVVTIMRNATVFGLAPRMRFDLAVNIMTADAVVQGRVSLNGDGEQWRPFIHVSDLVQAITVLLSSSPEVISGRIFNVGHERLNLTISELAQKIGRVIPLEIVLNATNKDTRSYNLDFSRIRNEVGFRARHGLELGIREIANSVKGRLEWPKDPICHNVQWYRAILQELRTIL